MSKFLLVQLFDPTYFVCDYEITQKPFWINTNRITSVWNYDPVIHAPMKEELDGTKTRMIPEGALDSVYINLDGQIYWLDAESSKKVLEAIE